ncbi:MAG: hypothetical protein ACTSQY_09975 [Candidatus Odinarchaeia archaeon]
MPYGFSLPKETRNLFDLLAEQLVGRQEEDIEKIREEAGARGFLSSPMVEELEEKRKEKTLQALKELAGGMGYEELGYRRQKEAREREFGFRAGEARKERFFRQSEADTQRAWQERMAERERERQEKILREAQRRQLTTSLIQGIPGTLASLVTGGPVGALTYLGGMGSQAKLTPWAGWSKLFGASKTASQPQSQPISQWSFPAQNQLAMLQRKRTPSFQNPLRLYNLGETYPQYNPLWFQRGGRTPQRRRLGNIPILDLLGGGQ